MRLRLPVRQSTQTGSPKKEIPKKLGYQNYIQSYITGGKNG